MLVPRAISAPSSPYTAQRRGFLESKSDGGKNKESNKNANVGAQKAKRSGGAPLLFRAQVLETCRCAVNKRGILGLLSSRHEFDFS